LAILTDRRIVFTLPQDAQAQATGRRGTQIRHAWIESVDLEEMIFPAEPKRFLKAAVPEKRFYLTSVRFVDHARSPLKVSFAAAKTGQDDRARSDQDAAIAHILSCCGTVASQSVETSRVAKMTVNYHRNLLKSPVEFAGTLL
jgi:hypothetical protein